MLRTKHSLIAGQRRRPEKRSLVTSGRLVVRAVARRRLADSTRELLAPTWLLGPKSVASGEHPMASRTEQRRSHRVPIEMPVEFASRESGEKVPGVSKDISIGGMFIETAFQAVRCGRLRRLHCARVATGDGGSHFQRHHRYLGTHPLTSTRFFALAARARGAHAVVVAVNLCEQLLDQDAVVPVEVFDEVEALGRAMGLNATIWMRVPRR
jgi:hypothetical protein